jgi:TonB family protein
MKNMRHLLLALIIVSSSPSAWSADLDEGKRAYESKNYALALLELRPLAESGDAEAEALLGAMYLQGNGMDKNESEAVAWYSKAAAHGNTEAQLVLSEMYREGKGVGKDATMSAYWQWKASVAFAAAAKKILFAEITKDRAVALSNKNSGGKVYVDAKKDPQSTCQAPGYPDEAVRKGQTGDVELFFIVDIDGSVIETHIAKSSGHPMLDKAAAAALSLCSFLPGTINGKVAPSAAKIRYRWTL